MHIVFGEKLLRKQTIMNVFTVVNPMMNRILPLTMCVPDIMEAITVLTIAYLPVDNVIKAKEVNTG